jgi:hypothetical protein
MKRDKIISIINNSNNSIKLGKNVIVKTYANNNNIIIYNKCEKKKYLQRNNFFD